MDLFFWVLKDQLKAEAILVNLPFSSIDTVKVEHQHSVSILLFHNNEQILCVRDKCRTNLNVLIKRCELNPMEQLSVIEVDQENEILKSWENYVWPVDTEGSYWGIDVGLLDEGHILNATIATLVFDLMSLLSHIWSEGFAFLLCFICLVNNELVIL